MDSNPTAPPPPSHSNAALLPSRVAICISEVIFMAVIFTCLSFIYKRCYSHHRPHHQAFIHATPAEPCGLSPAIMKAFPVHVYAADEEGEECPICLGKLMHGAKVRVLPRCEHEFHANCIDTWFHSHDTCPVCRATVGPVAASGGRLPLVWSPPVRDRIGSSSLTHVVVQS